MRGLGERVELEKSSREGTFADELSSLASCLRPRLEICELAFRKDDSELASRGIKIPSELKREFLEYTVRVADRARTAVMAIVQAGRPEFSDQ